MDTVIAGMIKKSGRSWWQTRYMDGKILSEWETLIGEMMAPIGLGRSSRWEEVPKLGMIGLRILCPNGMAGEIEAPIGHRFFQLKSGSVGVAIGGFGGISRHCDAHIIGVVVDIEGTCFCRAWETKERQLIEFYDNVFDMKYRNIGKLSLEVQQLRI